MNRLHALWIVHTTPTPDRIFSALAHGHAFPLDIARHGHMTLGAVYASLARLERQQVVISCPERAPQKRRGYALTPYVTKQTERILSASSAQRYAHALRTLKGANA